MRPQRFIVVGVLAAIVMLIVAGVFIFHNQNTSIQQVKVYEIPDTYDRNTIDAAPSVHTNGQIAFNETQQQDSADSQQSYIITADSEDLSNSDADLLSTETEVCCDEESDATFTALPLEDNPVAHAVIAETTAYTEYVKQHDAYIAQEEVLYNERQQLLRSFRELLHGNASEADLDTWKEKMMDWQKRSDALEDNAPERPTSDHQH